MTAKRKKTSSKSTSKTTAKGASASGAKKKKKAVRTRPDEMSDEVMDFITAIDDYKRQHERPFPNWSEVLEILKNLGYEKSPVE